jgi:hypothetical protein
MPKKHHKSRHLKGGFLGLNSLQQTFSNFGNSISQGATSFWDKTKKMTGIGNSSTPSSYTPPLSSSTPTSSLSSSPSPSYNAPQTTSYNNYGGKRLRKKTKRSRSKTMKRGGNFSANVPINSLASRAFPFTGLTARVNDLVGGKRNKTKRSRR